jgi:hypothetical protein
MEDAADTDPCELSRGDSSVRKDQTAANKTYKHRGD